MDKAKQVLIDPTKWKFLYPEERNLEVAVRFETHFFGVLTENINSNFERDLETAVNAFTVKAMEDRVLSSEVYFGFFETVEPVIFPENRIRLHEMAEQAVAGVYSYEPISPESDQYLIAIKGLTELIDVPYFDSVIAHLNRST